MKTQLKRRLLILLAALLIAAGFSLLLNRISFDPNFSMLDALTGATKHSKAKASQTDTATPWGYEISDLALPEDGTYVEATVTTGTAQYVVLQQADLQDAALFEGTLTILSDKANSDYEKAVREVAACYEAQGYQVEVRTCSETMMLSLAHAEHFELFLLREVTGS